MKVVLCLDKNQEPMWLAFPTTTEEIRTALKDRSVTVIDDDEIEYEYHERETYPEINDIQPFWSRPEFPPARS